MKEFIANLRYLFNRRDFFHFGILLLLLLGGAAIELLTLGAIPCYVAIVANDTNNPYVLYFIPQDCQTGHNLLQIASLLFLALFLFRLAYFAIMNYVQTRIICNRTIAVGTRTYLAFARAPYAVFLQRNTSEITNSIINETHDTIELVTEFLNMLRSGIVIFSIVAMLLWAQPLMASVSIAILGLLAGTILWMRSRFFTQQGAIENASRQAAIKLTNESIGAVKETKLLGCQGFFEGQVHSALERIGRASAGLAFNYRMFWPVLEIAVILALLSAMLLEMHLMDVSAISLAPGLALVAVSLTRIRTALTDWMLGYSKVLFNYAPMSHLCHILRELEPQAEPPVSVSEQSQACFRHTVEFQDVSFQYEGVETPSLHHLSLHFEHGKSYGLIGSTGAGKSTLLDLLLGLLNPTSGKITIDGIPLEKVRRPWQSTIGYVPQTIFLLDDTIAANIALGVPPEQLDQAALDNAIATAQLSDFIKSLPNGLKTMVGERGIRLSGGQRQRLAVARALYRRPAVLVFDEATSALDNDTEAALTAAINCLRENHTIIVVAHRLSTVSSCDCLYKLEGGKLVSSGSFAQVTGN